MMATTVDVSSLRERVRFVAADAMEIGTQRTHARLQETSPVVSSRLRDSFLWNVDSGPTKVTGRIVNDTPYAEYVVEGTRPHEIRAVNARALSFYWPKAGTVVHAKSVQHPGTTPNPFWSEALASWPDLVAAAL
jgi:hypothetical protein